MIFDGDCLWLNENDQFLAADERKKIIKVHLKCNKNQI